MGSDKEVLGKIKHWGKGVESSKTAENAEMLINEFKKASVDFLAKSKAVKSITLIDENGKDVGFYFLFRKYKKGGRKTAGNTTKTSVMSSSSKNVLRHMESPKKFLSILYGRAGLPVRSSSVKLIIRSNLCPYVQASVRCLRNLYTNPH